VVSSATKLAPAEPGFWSQLGDDFSDVLQGSQLASASFVAGILTGTSDLVKLGRDVDPMDPWNEAHPEEYLAGLSGLAAGVVQDAVDPQDFVEGVVGTGWGSDPAMAAGKLVPGVALAIATGGAGAAADGADAAAGAADGVSGGLGDAAGDPDAAGQPTDDMPTEGDPVNVATGDVVLTQADVRLPGALPLVIERGHRSSYRAGRWFGRSWASTLDQRLEVTRRGVFFAAPDGAVLCYPHPDMGGAPVLPAAGARWPLARLPGGAYTVTDPQTGTVRSFEPRSGFYQSAQGFGELPLVSVTRRRGDQVSFGYDQDGSPRSVTHDGGYQVQVQVAGGRVTGLVLAGAAGGGADAPLARYRYDAAGNLAEVINSSGAPLRFSYDDAGRLTGWEDRNGWAYRYCYDADGRCVRTEGPDGALSGTFDYDRGNLVTRHTDAAGSVTVYQLTAGSQVAAVTDPLGGVTREEHDVYGRLVSRTDPLGRVTRWSYDAAGNLTAISRPDGSQVSAVYNEMNLPVAVTEPGGTTWRQEYDEAGNLVRVTGPDGAVTGYSWDGRGHLAGITGPEGTVTTVACDAAGLPVTVTGPDGEPTSYARDGFGRVTAVTGPDGRVTRLAWTTEGLLASRVFPDGTAERFSYDRDGNLIGHLDPAAGLTRAEYGCFGLMAARTGPDGTTTTFGYDHALRLTSVTHGKLSWRYEYDAAGRLVAEADFNGAVTRYARDAAGQVTGQASCTGEQISYRYDDVGNMTERCVGGEVTTFSYDPAGRLVRAANQDVFIELERDIAGRVTAETCNGRTVRSQYDAAGRRLRRITPSGAETRWDYDRAGRLAAVYTGGQSITFGYDQAGRETMRELPGGATLAQRWDQAGRLATQELAAGAGPAIPLPGPAGQHSSARMMQRRGYRYRADGCLVGIEDLLSGPRQLTLDQAGRVVGVTGPGWDEAYGYDQAGNITAASWPVPPPGAGAGWLDSPMQGPREYSGTLIARAGDVSYRHDAQGRVITRRRVRLSRKPETWQYAWDADNRLTSVTTPDGCTWRYRYDPLGRRIAKQRLDPAGGMTERTDFTWDGSVLAEQVTTLATDGPAASHVITWDYRPGTFTPLAQAEHSGSTDASQDQVDQRFYAIITDLIGSPSELVDQAGDLAGYQQHTLWGGTLWHPGGAATPLSFPGQYADPETGLHYNHHRYYDPATGRYLSPDPLGLAPAPNPHAYVPNPCVGTDPLGLDPGAGGTGGGKVLWGSWNDYDHVTVDGNEYADVGGRLYTRHAVDRMQPSGLGKVAGGVQGRSISPNFVNDVIEHPESVDPVKGPLGQSRLSYVSGSVQVITENGIVVTIITR
jgi:RHS repeat-associated protein